MITYFSFQLENRYCITHVLYLWYLKHSTMNNHLYFKYTCRRFISLSISTSLHHREAQMARDIWSFYIGSGNIGCSQSRCTSWKFVPSVLIPDATSRSGFRFSFIPEYRAIWTDALLSLYLFHQRRAISRRKFCTYSA